MKISIEFGIESIKVHSEILDFSIEVKFRSKHFIILLENDHCQSNLASSLMIHYVYPKFQRKSGLAFYVNCLLGRQFT